MAVWDAWAAWVQVGGPDARRDEKRAAMGESWRNQPHVRVQLSLSEDGTQQVRGRAGCRGEGAGKGTFPCHCPMAGFKWRIARRGFKRGIVP
jgi:hypothetical protein